MFERMECLSVWHGMLECLAIQLQHRYVLPDLKFKQRETP